MDGFMKLKALDKLARIVKLNPDLPTLDKCMNLVEVLNNDSDAFWSAYFEANGDDGPEIGTAEQLLEDAEAQLAAQ